MRSCPQVCRSWRLLNRDRLVRIGPRAIRNQRIPSGPARIAIVRVTAELVEERVVAREFFAIELDAQTGLVGNADRTVDVAKRSSFDHVIDEMMVMRVRGIAEVHDDSAEMKHRRELNAELARTVDGDAQ